MPKSSILNKLAGCPQQSAEVQEGTTHDYPGGAVEPTKDNGGCGNDYCADCRIDEEHLLLVRAKIICLSENDDIYDHVEQQESEGKRVEETLGEPKMMHI